MAHRPPYPKVSFEFKPKDADSTFIAGMILFFVLGVITLFIYVPIGLIFLLIGFLFLAVLLYAISRSGGSGGDVF